jgi:glycosyltransferase involved in cell wall biosynthesis
MQNTGDRLLAFNSVVKELDVFVEIFDKITWIGFDYSDYPVDSSLLAIKYPQVQLIRLRRSGGTSLKSKIRILSLMPEYIFTIIKNINQSGTIHVRGPSVPMLIALVISFFMRKPKWWFKYANNWNDPSPPFFWRLQKKLMMWNSSTVSTVNGVWSGMPRHILPFENPCIYEKKDIREYLDLKSNKFGWRLLFVGRIEEKKGYKMVLDVARALPPDQLESLTFIGNGKEEETLWAMIAHHPQKSKIKYLGPLSNQDVHLYMERSHFLLLPSNSSEGFPKVVAESWNNGCIPVVSDVSCLEQYVEDKVNGFIWKRGGKDDYIACSLASMNIDEATYHRILVKSSEMSALFTYSRYKERIIRDIMKVNFNSLSNN